MPTKNSRKQYAVDSIYHVYTRGANKMPIFKEPNDYHFFISLFKRYLTPSLKQTSSRRPYPNYTGKVELYAFCLMRNHIHLLIYQKDEGSISKLVQSIMTSYSMYFNQKYKHYGRVFQGRYLASRIDQESYLEHISRYIHLNPKAYKDYNYSSLPYYTGNKHADWIKPDFIMRIFNNNTSEYVTFLDDFVGHQEMMQELKHDLANQEELQ